MATVSRGQIIERNRLFEATDMMSQSFDRLGKALEERRRLDMYEDQIDNEKWKTMHDALWKTIDADASTNALGFRGALENFRQPLNALYKLKGMKDDALRGMWDGFDRAPLSADALKRAAYSFYLQNGNFDNMTGIDAQERLAKELQREIQLGLVEAPKVQETREVTTQGPGGEPQARPPITLGEPAKEPTQPTPQRALGMNEAQIFIDSFWRENKRPPKPDEIPKELRGEAGKVIAKVAKATETQKTLYPGASHPARAQGIPQTSLKTVERDMTQPEVRAWMIKENKLPASVAETLRTSGSQYQTAVDAFVTTGVLPKGMALGKIKQVGNQMAMAFQKPQYVQKLWERLLTRDPETGMNALEGVTFQLGASQVGSSNPQATMYQGQQMLVAIFEDDYMKTKVAERQVAINEKRWALEGKYFATLKLPWGGTRDFTLGEFLAFQQWNTDINTLMMKQSNGGFDMETLLKLQEFRKKFEEPLTNKSPEKFRQGLALLRATNPVYDWVVETTDKIRNLQRQSMVDSEGNPLPPIPGTPEVITLPGPLAGVAGWVDLFGMKPGLWGGKQVMAGETTARAFQETPKPGNQEKDKVQAETEGFFAERGGR